MCCLTGVQESLFQQLCAFESLFQHLGQPSKKNQQRHEKICKRMLLSNYVTSARGGEAMISLLPPAGTGNNPLS